LRSSIAPLHLNLNPSVPPRGQRYRSATGF
jgi:hypothetical protein